MAKDRIYIDMFGRKWGNDKRECCLFCKHCTDIFLDATNGPYLFICDMGYEMGDENCLKHYKEDPDTVYIDTDGLKKVYKEGEHE